MRRQHLTVSDNVQQNQTILKLEPASVWSESKTTPAPIIRKFDLRKSEEQESVSESNLSLIDNEVERDPKEWELKMKQLSRELSTILHRLKVTFLTDMGRCLKFLEREGTGPYTRNEI